MQKLLFKNPVFHKGVNVTCRKGTKWSGINGEVVIAETGGKDVCIATIKNTKTLRFMDLEEKDIVNEHDPSCRTWQGLYDVMVNTYGDFDKRELVTILEFEPILQYDTIESIW
jgi:hypothetical protein